MVFFLSKRVRLHRPRKRSLRRFMSADNMTRIDKSWDLIHRLTHPATKIPFMSSFSGNYAASVPISDFHIHVSLSNLYISRIGPQISCSRKADRWWEYINRSQTHECGNWDWGRAIPFLGIYVSSFRYWLFAVQSTDLHHCLPLLIYVRYNKYLVPLHSRKFVSCQQISAKSWHI